MLREIGDRTGDKCPERYHPLAQDATATAVKMSSARIWLGGGDTYSEGSTSHVAAYYDARYSIVGRSESRNSFPFMIKHLTFELINKQRADRG